LGVTPATTSLAIDRLQARGYVTRAIDTNDRRRVLLRLTHAGARVCEAQRGLEPALVDAMLATLTADDRAVAIRGLHLLAQGRLRRANARGRPG
jgi:DNA-binding MarR family transcriptional regulator